jgi:hypothetical protein
MSDNEADNYAIITNLLDYIFRVEVLTTVRSTVVRSGKVHRRFGGMHFVHLLSRRVEEASCLILLCQTLLSTREETQHKHAEDLFDFSSPKLYAEGMTTKTPNSKGGGPEMKQRK